MSIHSESLRHRPRGAAHGALVALLLALALAVVSPAAGLRAQDRDAPSPWMVEVPESGTLVVDLPAGWEPSSTREGETLAEWRATTRNRCELVLLVRATEQPDPAFNGPDALRAFVRGQAEALLPQAIESHYTLKTLRGQESGGFYFGLRARAPRRKQAAYITQGAVGLGNLRLEFTITSPVPDPPEIEQALKTIAAGRILRPVVEGETP